MGESDLRRSSRLISGHGDESVADKLAEVVDWCRGASVEFDSYGNGELIQQFEREVAELLGYPAARFMPSGTLAQQVALRIWSDRSGINHFAMHPTSHLELHEERGYSNLHGLRATLVGPADQPMLAEHLDELLEPVSSLLMELPIREAGGLLPSWAELGAIKSTARDRDIKLHLDGARLWECGPAYDKSYAEICEGFDSVYVSFYKGIGALPGAILAGPEDFVAEAAIWQRRSGGNLFTMTPNVASAALQFEHRIAFMPTLLERARQVAGVLSSIDGISVKPNPPHVNMFHLYMDLDAEEALMARDRVARDLGLWVFGWVAPSEVRNVCSTEIYIGDAAMAVSDADIEDAFTSLMTGVAT